VTGGPATGSAPLAGVPGRPAPAASPGSPAPPLADGFAARWDTVPGLEAALVPGGAVALVSAAAEASHDPAGWAGACGKTQLAAHAARSLRRAGAVDVVAWVTATSRMSVLEGYAQAAAVLGLGHADDAGLSAARFAAWLAGTGQPWLVVLDDLRNRADLDGLWPAGPAGRLLITTREPAAVEGERVRVLPTGMFSPREAVGYLSGRLTRDPGQRAGQLDLAADLDGEPAALAHASAVIATAELTCWDYRQYYLEQKTRLEAAAGGPVPAAAVTWMLSARHAEIIAPGAGTWPLLVLAALLDGDAIPVTVFTASAATRYLTGASTARPAVGEPGITALHALQDAGLVTIDAAAEPPAVRMNGPLRAAVLAAAAPELLAQAAVAAADALDQSWPKDKPAAPAAAPLRSCTVTLRAAAPDALWAGGACHRVLLAAGQSMDAAGLVGPAAGWWRQLAADSSRLLGDTHPGTVTAGGLLAESLVTAGQAAEAVTWARWAAGQRAALLGPDHRRTIAARTCLGRALTAAGCPGDAALVLDDAVRASELIHGAADDATVTAREAHAAACLAAGDHAAAIRSLRQALSAREQARGPGHPATVATVTALAAALLAAGQADAAIGWHQQVLARRERTHGPEHPGTLAARAALAAACAAAGRMDSAQLLYRQACAGYERVLGGGHPETLDCRAALARAYYDAGQVGDALLLLRAVIAVSGPEGSGALRDLLAEITGETTAW
jgi:Tetratricopeptide repeat